MNGDPTADFDVTAVEEAADDAQTTLLLAADDDPLADECCVALSSANGSAATRLLSVTVGGPPDGRLGAWRTYAGGLPSRTGIIAVGETTRSSAATDGGTVAPGSGPVSVDVVEDPSDLAGLALAVNAYLEAWDDQDEREESVAGPDGEPLASTSLCLHSLSGLLEDADVSHVFRFLHATFGLLRKHGATAHVHLDPDEHDDVTVNTLRVLFDAVVRVEADGSLAVE